MSDTLCDRLTEAVWVARSAGDGDEPVRIWMLHGDWCRLVAELRLLGVRRRRYMGLPVTVFVGSGVSRVVMRSGRVVEI